VTVFLNFIIGTVDLCKIFYKIGNSKGNLQFAKRKALSQWAACECFQK